MEMDIKKFSWAESFNNSQGKSSIALVSGFVLICTSCLAFLWTIIIKSADGAAASMAFATLGAGLLGIRRFTKDKDVTTMSNGDETVVTKSAD